MSADATGAAAGAARVNPNAPTEETVLAVEHYTDRLFRFRITRPRSFRFRSGEFVMIGLPKEDGRPLLRAYSVASPAWDEELEFYSIKVPDGPLTSRLCHIQPGDRVLLGKKPTGTLVLDALLPANVSTCSPREPVLPPSPASCATLTHMNAMKRSSSPIRAGKWQS